MFKWKNKKNDNKKYVANYFFIAEKLISKYKPDSIVTMQFFQRKENAILCGINEALDFLKKKYRYQKI